MLAIVLTGTGETVWKDCMHSFYDGISFNLRVNNSQTVIRTELVFVITKIAGFCDLD